MTELGRSKIYNVLNTTLLHICDLIPDSRSPHGEWT